MLLVGDRQLRWNKGRSRLLDLLVGCGTWAVGRCKVLRFLGIGMALHRADRHEDGHLSGWELTMENSCGPPQRPSYYPEPVFAAWHVREVFQGEARYGGIT